MAPEVLMGKEYTEKCDVYSFGIGRSPNIVHVRKY